MTQETWNAVDEYLNDTLVLPDAVLEAALQASAAAGLPAINVSPAQGKFLHLLARVQGARNILEVGTLGGYSAIWLARALPPGGGRLITLEVDAKHAEVARANLARAGLANVTQVRLGRAIDTLPELERESAGPFDLVFIDADKQNYSNYFDLVVDRMRPGGLIIADNVLWSGKVLDDPATHDAETRGLAHYAAKVKVDARVENLLLPLRDGLLISRRR